MLLALTATAGVLSHSSFEALNDDGTFFFSRGESHFCERGCRVMCLCTQRVWELFLLHLQKKKCFFGCPRPVSGSDYTRRAEAGDHHIWTEPNHNGDGTSTGYWLQDALKG